MSTLSESVCRFEQSGIDLTEVKVNDEGDPRTCEEEIGAQPPYIWWKLEDQTSVVRNQSVRDAS